MCIIWKIRITFQKSAPNSATRIKTLRKRIHWIISFFLGADLSLYLYSRSRPSILIPIVQMWKIMQIMNKLCPSRPWIIVANQGVRHPKSGIKKKKKWSQLWNHTENTCTHTLFWASVTTENHCGRRCEQKASLANLWQWVILSNITFSKKKIYLFLAALGLCCCTWVFSSCGEQGVLFVAVCRFLIAVASLVAEHGL